MRMQNRAIIYLMIVFAYVITGKAALMLALPPGYASPIFPPAGIAVAATLIGGMRMLPWIFTGSLLLNIWVAYSANPQISALSLVAALIIAVASMLQAAIGGWALRRAKEYQPVPRRHRDILHLLSLTPAICLVSANLSVGGLFALGIFKADSIVSDWLAWWIGDMLGLISMLPLAMTIADVSHERRRSKFFGSIALPVLSVLLGGLVAIYFLQRIAFNAAYEQQKIKFDTEVNEVRQRIEQRMMTYEQVLQGAQGLFAATKRASRGDFHEYITSLRLTENYPGIQGVGFSLIVPQQKKNLQIEEIHKEGFPSYRIWPEGAREFYTPVIYLEPFSERNLRAFGYDMYSENVRRAAMEQARDSGNPTLSGKVILVQEGAQREQSGFLLYLPIYRNGSPHKTLDNRRANIIGWVYSPFRMNDLMQGILGVLDRNVDLEIYDGVKANSDTQMYDSNSHQDQSASPEFSAYRPLNIASHDWTVRVHSLKSFEVQSLDNGRLTEIRVGGLAITLLLSLLILQLSSERARAQGLAEEMTRELRESESRFRNTLELAPIGMVIATLDGRIKQANQSFCTMLGYSKDEIEKLSVIDITHPDDLVITLASLKPLQEGEIDSLRLEKRYLRKDGQVIWGLVASSVEKDDDGKPLDNIVQIENITERRIAEQKIKDNESLLSFALEGAGDGIWDWNVLTGQVSLSRAGAAMFGYQPHEASHDIAEWYARLPSEDQVRWTEMLRSFFHEKAERFSLEYRVRCKNGDYIWILTRGMVVSRTADGKVSRLTGMHSNITQRKLSDELLRKSSEEIEDLYNHAPCGYHSLDQNGIIVRINDTELNWLGYSRDEVVGKLKMSDLLTSRSSQAFQKGFLALKKRGALSDFENEFMRKDGTLMQGLVNATAIKNADGEFQMSRSTVFDITERKKTEERLHTLFTAIEHSPIAVIITDVDTNILYVSPSFTQITGYPSAEVVNRNLRVLQAGKFDKYSYSEMWNALAKGKSWHGELINKNKQGREYWEDVHITPVKNPEGDVCNYVVVSSDISERKITESRMRHLASYDQLTDLPNRSLINDRTQQALTTAKRDKTHTALMFLDLDKFKPINDTLGHDVGDMLLKEVSKRMQDSVRESDTVGRVGGDEFVVLLPTVETDQDAMQVAEKIRYSLNQPFFIAGYDLHISSSIGLAIYPEHGDDIKALVKNADIAMYYAKGSGRNRALLFNSGMLEE